MSVKADVTKAWMESRKAKDTVRATILGFWKSEADTMAKNEGVETTDDHFVKAGKRMLKNLEKTREASETTEVLFEIKTVEFFMPEDKASTEPLDVIVKRLLESNPGKPDKAVMGMVMKETKGRFKPDEVLEAISNEK